MKTTTLRITKAAFDNLKAHLLRNDKREHLAFLPIGVQAKSGNIELLAFDCWPVEDSNLVHGARRDHLELSPQAYLKVLNRAIQLGVGLIEIHNHPGSNAPFFSWSDDAGLAEVVPHMLASLPIPHYSALVINDNAEFVGRHWQNAAEQAVPIVDIEVLDLKRTRLLSADAPPQELRLASAMFDRQIRAFGVEGQQALSSLKVGIVGLGGIGSVQAPQLAHMGVHNFVLVDSDRIEHTNLNRVLAATLDHVAQGEFKTSIAANYIRALNPSANVVEVRESVFSQSALYALAECDLVISGTDNSASRYAVSELCQAYLRPHLDLGTQIEVKDGVIESIGGRYTFAIPGFGCLLCSQAIDPHEAAKELRPPELIQHDKCRGYIVGGDEPAPSVLPLNSAVVSLALNEVLAWATGWRPAKQQALFDGRKGSVSMIDFAQSQCCMICHEILGRGDRANLSEKYARFGLPKQKEAS